MGRLWPRSMNGSFRAEAKEVDRPTDAGGGTRTREGQNLLSKAGGDATTPSVSPINEPATRKKSSNRIEPLKGKSGWNSMRFFFLMSAWNPEVCSPAGKLGGL